VFITTCVINDTESYANQLEQILISKNVAYQYIKVNEGHSWGNWSALLDDILLYFYAK
jgi:enterochelin esterase-like enzyme